jgi:lysylphosphatidylglycerol synthetase-like protein (DUF2156 family)
MLVNSLFCKIFNLYSVWSLVIFEIVFTIPFGLLSFRYTNQIIIASSSLTGAYFVIRPISWAFGGFPNEFLLYEMIQTNTLKSLPLAFFFYLILIIALAIVGAMYQLMYKIYDIENCKDKTPTTRYKSILSNKALRSLSIISR